MQFVYKNLSLFFFLFFLLPFFFFKSTSDSIKGRGGRPELSVLTSLLVSVD